MTTYSTLTLASSTGLEVSSKVNTSSTSGVPFISQGTGSAPVFGTALVAGGGTGATTLTGVLTGNGTSAFTASTVTQHGVVVAGASNALSSVAPSTSGNVLTSNGTDWTSASSSGLGSVVLIASTTASTSASITFTSIGSYQNYMLVFEGFKPDTDAVNLLIQLSVDAGSNYITSGYTSGFNWTAYNSAVSVNVNSTAGFIVAGPQSTSNSWVNSVYFLYDMRDGSNFTNGSGQASFQNSTTDVASFGTAGGLSGNFAAVTALKVLFSSGNITSGRVSLYGIKVA